MDYRIGIDFDNTLVCYDRAFHRAALDRGLIALDVPAEKIAIRNYLRQSGREEDWTELQGFVYGPGIQEAELFPGVRTKLQEWRDAGVSLYIVSHKTQYPYKGPAYDLHQHAREWLTAMGFCEGAGAIFGADSVFLEPTKEAKLHRVAQLRCDAFIDDLPEILGHPLFPSFTRAVLFDPSQEAEMEEGWTRMPSWESDVDLFLCTG